MLEIKKAKQFQKWFDDLKDKKLQLTIARRIERIEKDEYFGKTYPIANGLSEIKIEMGAGYRVYFNFYVQDNKVWFLCGGDKSTQSRDIEAAKELLQEIQKQREEKNGIQIHHTRRR
jgi:putative addiction module killer protein